VEFEYRWWLRQVLNFSEGWKLWSKIYFHLFLYATSQTRFEFNFGPSVINARVEYNCIDFIELIIIGKLTSVSHAANFTFCGIHYSRTGKKWIICRVSTQSWMIFDIMFQNIKVTTITIVTYVWYGSQGCEKTRNFKHNKTEHCWHF
jgi:hypothetical protein